MSSAVSFPHVLLPSELISLPHTVLGPCPKDQSGFLLPTVPPCYLLDGTAGTRRGLEEHRTGLEAFSLLVSISKDI